MPFRAMWSMASWAREVQARSGTGQAGSGAVDQCWVHGDPGQGLSCPPGQLGDVAAGFCSAVSGVGADVHGVNGAGPQQAVEVGGEDVPLDRPGSLLARCKSTA